VKPPGEDALTGVDGAAEDGLLDRLLAVVVKANGGLVPGTHGGRRPARAVEQLDAADLGLTTAEAGALALFDLLGSVGDVGVLVDDLWGRADLLEVAVVEPGDLIAEGAHLLQAVGDDDDGATVLAELGELVHAPLLELHVADGQDLVDQEDLRLDVNGHREAQTHIHARGVVLHRLIDELTHPGEVDDVIELGLDLLAAHPQDGAVEEDVLPPGELGMEARADLQHGGHAPPGGDGARIGSQDLGDALEQRGLA